MIARHIAPNRRLLCAVAGLSGQARHARRCRTTWRGTTASASARARKPTACGAWPAARGRNASTEAVKTRGNLTTNDGEIAVNWALDGHGILMRAEWDIERYLRNGRLVQVLPQYYTPDADIYAVYPQRHQLAARVRAFVDFLALSFTQQAAAKT